MAYKKKWGGGGYAKKGAAASTESEEDRIELGNNRFVSVSVFNGKTNVSIREYYQKDGQLLPGKKGISLTLEQWEALKDLMPDIDTALDEQK